MSTLRITLRHANLLETPCALIFIKHIQGAMSAPETALDAATGGRLKQLYSQHEREDHEVLETQQHAREVRVRMRVHRSP